MNNLLYQRKKINYQANVKIINWFELRFDAIFTLKQDRYIRDDSKLGPPK